MASLRLDIERHIANSRWSRMFFANCSLNRVPSFLDLRKSHTKKLMVCSCFTYYRHWLWRPWNICPAAHRPRMDVLNIVFVYFWVDNPIFRDLCTFAGERRMNHAQEPQHVSIRWWRASNAISTRTSTIESLSQRDNVSLEKGSRFLRLSRWRVFDDVAWISRSFRPASAQNQASRSLYKLS